MTRLFGLLALLLLMALLLKISLVRPEAAVPLSMSLGFLLLAGFMFGKLGK